MNCIYCKQERQREMSEQKIKRMKVGDRVIEPFICAECGGETYCLTNSRKSSIYGVIFDNEKLCEQCAEKRYDKFVENYHAASSDELVPPSLSANADEKLFEDEVKRF